MTQGHIVAAAFATQSVDFEHMCKAALDFYYVDSFLNLQLTVAGSH